MPNHFQLYKRNIWKAHFGNDFFSQNFYFPHYTVVNKALLYVFSECKCHRLQYLGKLSTSKRVGLLQSPNLMIFALFLKYQSAAAARDSKFRWGRKIKPSRKL
jgi:hypothetical protein